MCKSENYPWSSWNSELKNEIINSNFITQFLGTVEFMETFIKTPNNDICDETEIKSPPSDEHALLIVKKTLSIHSQKQLRSLTLKKLLPTIPFLKSQGISIRQLQRILSY